MGKWSKSSRAERRADRDRMIARVKQRALLGYWGFPELANNPRWVGQMVANHSCVCSCEGCVGDRYDRLANKRMERQCIAESLTTEVSS